MTSPVRLALLIALTAGAAQAAEQAPAQPARSRLCPEDLPEGVRLPPQPGCAAGTRPAPARRQGSYDLGDGTTLQVGGRASVESGVRR